MKNILLLTDFTAKSENAHHYACQLMAGESCTFYFLSVQKIWEYTTDDVVAASYDQSLDDALLGDNRTKNNEAIKKFEKQYTDEDFSFQGIVDYDDFIHSVNQVAQKFQVDLIVVGTNGRSDVVEYLFSSHTLRLARNVNFPLLVIPEDYKFQEPKQLQYLLDYDDYFEACGKDLLMDIVDAYNAKIHFYRLTFGKEFDYEQNEIEKQQLQSIFNHQEIRFQTFIDADPADVLLESLIDEPAQMQVLSAKLQTFVERVFSNSHLSEVVKSAPIPLLILRDCK